MKDKDIFISVRLQSWFGEKRERYWVVDENRIENSAITPCATECSGSESGSGSQDDEITQGVEVWREEANERRLTLNAKPPTVEVDPWLRYTGWHEVLLQSKHNLTATAAFVRMPDANEVRPVRVLHSWSQVLKHCLNTLAAVNHKDTLKWWHSPKNEIASQHPFELPQNAQTLTKYSRQWQSFLCYVMRTAPEDTWEEESETGVKYTEQQWRSIDEVRYLLDDKPVVVAVTDGDAKGDTVLDTALMGLIVSIITQDTSQIPLYASPLMHFLAVCGVDSVTQSFRRSFAFTPILAKVLWIIRLLLLEYALPLQAWPEIGIQDCTQVGAVAVRVQKIRQTHLCEGSFLPASSILTQLARGKAINKLHRSPSNIYWSDDRQTVYHEGKGVAVAKIRTMWVNLVQELQEILQELLFHQSVPEVLLSQVIDQMGSAQDFRHDGLSFINHINNQKTCQRDWQFSYQRMLQDEVQWSLVYRSGSDCPREWIDIRKSAYLNRERQFLRLLMVA